jgi:MoaA/NifB/PqqE/SkfB family radical SAM enzyme
LGKRLDMPNFEVWRARTVRDAISLILEAIVDTPYGEPLKLSEPLFVTLSTSQYCPIGCANCYSNSQKDHDDRTNDRFLSNCRQVAESRSPTIAILGGEPFLHPDLVEGVNVLTRAGKGVSVATNWKVSREQLHRFQDRQLVSMLLSLWGDRSKHDALRGRGSYERIVANARAASEFGMKCSLLVVANDMDLEIFDEAEALLKREAFDVVQVTRRIAVGRRGEPNLGDRWNNGTFVERARALRRYSRQLIMDWPELRPVRKRRAAARVFGIAPFVGCGAGSWLWHLDSRGEGHACPVSEGAGTSGRRHNALNFLEAWRNREFNSERGRPGCIFENRI